MPMKRILVIDDEEWLREMVQMALEQKGFEVSRPRTGRWASRWRARSLPDLILCDVNMEKMDGYLTLLRCATSRPRLPSPSS